MGKRGWQWVDVCGRVVLLSLSFQLGSNAFADSVSVNWDHVRKNVKRVFVVVFENTDTGNAATQPYFKSIMQKGASLMNYSALTHPSQPNYIAMVAGDLLGVTGNNNVNLKERHIGNLLEDRGKTWKAYAEDYPGDAKHCFTGKTSGPYARRHNPFISFINVTQTPEACSKVVNAKELIQDVQKGTLPNFSFFIPNNNNNGHDTSVEYADAWFQRTFDPLFKDPKFMDETLFVATFDESASNKPNQVLTVLYGAGVRPGFKSDLPYGHYNLLATEEKIFDIGNLGRNDVNAKLIDDVWVNEN